MTFLLSPVIQQSGRSENVFNNPGMSDVERMSLDWYPVEDCMCAMLKS